MEPDPGTSAHASTPHPDRSVRRRVLRHLLPSARASVLLLVVVGFTTALPLLGPQLTRAFVDGANSGREVSWLVLVAAGYLVVAVFGQGFRLLTAWLASRLAWDGTNRLREDLAEHALDLDMSFHGKRTPGEMIERVDGDVVALAEFVVAFLLDVVVSLLLLVGVIAIVLVVDWRIGSVLLVYCGLIGFGMVSSQRLIVPHAIRVREMFARLFGNVEERLAGAEDIRANGAGEHAVNRLHQISADVYRADRAENKVGGGLFAGTTFAFAAGTAIVLGLAAWARDTGTLTLGTAVLLFQYTQMVRTPFERLVDQLEKFQKALAGVGRIGQLLGERRTLRDPDSPTPLPAAGPLSVELSEVDFAYADDGERVLSGVNLRLEPGETLGLVGRTGSGKTTIARLVLRLYDPTSGAVRVGGVDLRETDRASLRSRVSIVTQDVQLFAASVRDNLTLFGALGYGGGDGGDGGDGESDSAAGSTNAADAADGAPLDARLRDVLHQVGLGEWLDRLPRGLDTDLGAQGSQAGGLSAGEAQLLAFARTFLADPGVVVLDEASSRLDPATESVIEDGIEKLLTERTGVLIAHRLSSLRRVDQVAVIDNGRVVEYGRREALVADPSSHFAQLLLAAGEVTSR